MGCRCSWGLAAAVGADANSGDEVEVEGDEDSLRGVWCVVCGGWKRIVAGGSCGGVNDEDDDEENKEKEEEKEGDFPSAGVVTSTQSRRLSTTLSIEEVEEARSEPGSASLTHWVTLTRACLGSGLHSRPMRCRCGGWVASKKNWVLSAEARHRRPLLLRSTWCRW
jgi:hypothetical protein